MGILFLETKNWSTCKIAPNALWCLLIAQCRFSLVVVIISQEVKMDHVSENLESHRISELSYARLYSKGIGRSTWYFDILTPEWESDMRKRVLNGRVDLSFDNNIACSLFLLHWGI